VSRSTLTCRPTLAVAVAVVAMAMMSTPTVHTAPPASSSAAPVAPRRTGGTPAQAAI